jgi:hypothetical protein
MGPRQRVQTEQEVKRRDFTVSDHGTIFLLQPHTDAAVDWVNAYLPEDATWFGPSVAVEHRYIRDIVAGIQADGLRVK